jgi:MmyB-like transcription regulator ligand binding domain
MSCVHSQHAEQQRQRFPRVCRVIHTGTVYSPVLAIAAVGPATTHPANTARFIYLDPAARDFFLDYDRMAQDAAALLRLEAGRNHYDADLIALVAKCPPRANCSAASRRPTTSSSTAAAANDSVTPQSANSTSTSKAWNCPPTPTYGSISTPPTQALTPPTGSPAQHLGSHYPPGHRRPTHALNRRTAPAAPANSAIPGSVMARQAQSEQDTNRLGVGQRRGEADSAASARLAGGR